MIKQNTKAHKLSHSATTTNWIMVQVILACIPGVLITNVIFGFGIFLNVVFCIFTALILEATCLRLRNKPVAAALKDCSAIVTALLFAVCLPPTFSVFKIILGLFFAIVVAKHIYGGLGHNIFNPAMLGYVVLLVAFPRDFIHWEVVNSLISPIADDISQATPLDPIISGQHPYLKEIYLINLAWLLGGAYLLYKKIAPYSLAVGFLVGLFVVATLSFYMGQTSYYPFQHMLLGATMIGAFFIVTDPVTAPVSISGRWIYSILAGSLCYLIREYGSYPDGVGFAVLFMNSWVPLINRMIIKRPKLNV